MFYENNAEMVKWFNLFSSKAQRMTAVRLTAEVIIFRGAPQLLTTLMETVLLAFAIKVDLMLKRFSKFKYFFV